MVVYTLRNAVKYCTTGGNDGPEFQLGFVDFGRHVELAD